MRRILRCMRLICLVFLKIVLVLVLFMESSKLVFFIIADVNDRIIDEVERVAWNSDEIIYFNLIDGRIKYENNKICEIMPELKIIEMMDGSVLRIGIDDFYSYYLKYLFDIDTPEKSDTSVTNNSKFKNRTYREQLLSWHSIMIPLNDDLNIIYFLREDDPYIGFVPEEREDGFRDAKDRLAWDKYNENNIASSFLEIDAHKIQRELAINEIELEMTISELNELLKSSYGSFVAYEAKLRLYSFLISITKILILCTVIWFKQFKKLVVSINEKVKKAKK